jgi:TonB family protein
MIVEAMSQTMLGRLCTAGLLAAVIAIPVFAAPAATAVKTPSKSCKPEYPKEALQKGEEGVTVVAFQIAEDGTLPHITVLSSSGSPALDQAAVNVLSECVLHPQPGERSGTWHDLEYNWFLEGDPRQRPFAKKLKLASDEGNAAASFHLSQVMQVFATSDTERQDAVSLLKTAAIQGDIRAQYQLGRLYERGTGVKADRDEAMRWYKTAADQGEIMALQRLGKADRVK